MKQTWQNLEKVLANFMKQTWQTYETTMGKFMKQILADL